MTRHRKETAMSDDERFLKNPLYVLWGINPEDMPLDPEHWWTEADRLYKDAASSLAARQSRETVLFELHGACERALKAVLAQDGKLNEEFRCHSLVKHASETALKKELSEENWRFVSYVSNLHVVAGYSYVRQEERPWADVELYKNLVIGLGRLYGRICAMRVDPSLNVRD